MTVHIYSELSINFDARTYVQITSEDLHLSFSPFLGKDIYPLEFTIPRKAYDQIERSQREMHDLQNLIMEALRDEGSWPEEKYNEFAR